MSEQGITILAVGGHVGDMELTAGGLRASSPGKRLPLPFGLSPAASHFRILNNMIN